MGNTPTHLAGAGGAGSAGSTGGAGGSGRSRSAANRLGIDYRAEAARLGAPPVPIVDAHCHIGGVRAARLCAEAGRAFGVERWYSMTQLHQAAAVRSEVGDAVRFIAVPSWSDPDRSRVQRQGYLDVIEQFGSKWGARIMKIWSAPRLRELIPDGAEDLWDVDSPWRVRACEAAQRLGMMFMVHIADPDTWFSTRYRDAAVFGTKRSQYDALERMVDRFGSPWIAAHFGGWPENLEFLDGLLSRHGNLCLDTSATKWMVRELSKHPADELADFLGRWEGRLIFGSDVVSMEEHLLPSEEKSQSPMADLAGSAEAAFDLYASRYYALRLMWETDYDGESPIADPDLMMVEPGKHNELSAPRLVGRSLPRGLLVSLYSGAADRVIGGWERSQPA